MTENSPVWFSHREYRYDAELKGEQRVFHWTDGSEIWDWDNCTVSAVKREQNKVRVVIRSTHTVYSQYRKRDVKLRYMLGFDVEPAKIHPPVTEDYPEPPEHNVKNKVYGQPGPRWVIQLEDRYWIWEWAEQGKRIEDSNTYKIYTMIKDVSAQAPSRSNIFNVPTNDDGRIIPVIYQPAIDSWKNFVREVHCHKINDKKIEVTILFNNEQLREHAILNQIYEWIRWLIYRRVVDIETFRIILGDEVSKDFKFPGIYSGENGIHKDDIHEDKPDIDGKVPTHKIKYYFVNMKHPIDFVNTSNHAMAEHDTNDRLWKWEYVPWEGDSPAVYGEKSRKQIDRSFLASNVWKSVRWFQRYQFILLLSVGYGVWFSYLDVIPTIGKVFGSYYQVWNYLGHPLPSLFWLFIAPKKWEFWVAAILISTAVMDSPLWGAIREIQGYNFWCDPSEPFRYREDCTFREWFAFYYNPIGNYTILGRESTLTFSGIFIPTAWMMFTSLLARFVGAWLLIYKQYRDEKRKKGYLKQKKGKLGMRG